MARTYTKLVYHIVFSTKERIPLITGEIRDRLYPYIGGVIRGEKGSLMEIGGVADHVHILARFGAAVTISEMVKRIKGSSSHWLSQELGTWFAWQAGYGASRSASLRWRWSGSTSSVRRSITNGCLSRMSSSPSCASMGIEFDEEDLLD